MQKTEDREPRAPQHNLLHLLGVHHSEDEDELVEHKVPEFVFHVLQQNQLCERSYINFFLNCTSSCTYCQTQFKVVLLCEFKAN